MGGFLAALVLDPCDPGYFFHFISAAEGNFRGSAEKNSSDQSRKNNTRKAVAAARAPAATTRTAAATTRSRKNCRREAFPATFKMVDQTAGFLYESAIMMATPFATAIFCIVMAQRVRCMKLMWPKKLVCWERTRFIVHSAMRVLICLLGFFFVWFPFMRLLICFLECFIQMEDNFRKYYFMPTMTLILMLVYLHGYFQSKDGKTANVSHNATTHKKKMRAPAEDPDADALGRFWANTFYWSSPDE